MKKLVQLSLLALTASVASANPFALYDDSFSLFNGSTQISTGVYDVRWGTVTGTGQSAVFTPFLGAADSVDNSGYIDPSSPELTITFTQGSNANVAAGTALALAITFRDEGLDYASSPIEAILTDPSWIAPTFVFLSTPSVDVSFSSATVAVKGLYSFNGGNEIINLVAVPEPSTYAAIAGLAVLGAVATRRRRSA